MQRDLLIRRRTGDAVLDAVLALRADIEQAVAVGRAVGHGGIGNALRVLYP
ncbi:hypothetical protein D3C81_2268810 [compost metagenome]